MFDQSLWSVKPCPPFSIGCVNKMSKGHHHMKVVSVPQVKFKIRQKFHLNTMIYLTRLAGVCAQVRQCNVVCCVQVKCVHLIYKAKIIQAERDDFNNYQISLQKERL